jgi:hypothetical protein
MCRYRAPLVETTGTIARVTETPREFPAAMVAEAATQPGGWVYEIDPAFDPDGAVPPEGIRGARKIGEDGLPTGEYKANPNYIPSSGKRD